MAGALADYAALARATLIQFGVGRFGIVSTAGLVQADAVGPTLYYGAGAGSEPTASAVVADIIDVVRTLTADPGNRVPHLAFQPHALADVPILPMDDVETAYYLKMLATDKPGVLADVTRILGDAGISIEAILQKEPAMDAVEVPIIMLTARGQEIVGARFTEPTTRYAHGVLGDAVEWGALRLDLAGAAAVSRTVACERQGKLSFRC